MRCTIWQILIGYAHRRETITYLRLADLMRFGGAGVFDKMLGHIHYYCVDVDAPTLNSIVVRSDTEEPGAGIPDPHRQEDQDRVFAFNWYAHHVPGEAEMHDARLRGETAAAKAVAARAAQSPE